MLAPSRGAELAKGGTTATLRRTGTGSVNKRRKTTDLNGERGEETLTACRILSLGTSRPTKILIQLGGARHWGCGGPAESVEIFDVDDA